MPLRITRRRGSSVGLPKDILEGFTMSGKGVASPTGDGDKGAGLAFDEGLPDSYVSGLFQSDQVGTEVAVSDRQQIAEVDEIELGVGCRARQGRHDAQTDRLVNQLVEVRHLGSSTSVGHANR